MLKEMLVINFTEGRLLKNLVTHFKVVVLEPDGLLQHWLNSESKAEVTSILEKGTHIDNFSAVQGKPLRSWENVYGLPSLLVWP